MQSVVFKNQPIKKMKKIIFTFSVLCLLLYSCKDNNIPDPSDLPFNPFDTLTYPLPEIETIPVDSNGFLGLHHYIFSASCNRPGCHDGTFEPDFRTVESCLLYTSDAADE